MSSAGSPRWASSQSSTARRPLASTRKLPIRKSPWTTTRSSAGGRPGPATAPPARGPDAPRASASRKSSGSPSGSARRQARARTPDRWRGWRPGPGPPGRSGPVGRRRTRRPAGFVGGWPPLESFDDQPPGIEPVVGAGGHHVRHRDPGPRGPPAAGPLPSGCQVAGRGPPPCTCCRISARTVPEGVSRSKALVTRDAPPESRRSDPPDPRAPRPSCSATLGGVRAHRRTLSTRRLRHRNGGPPVLVDLVEVLGDAVSGHRGPSPSR